MIGILGKCEASASEKVRLKAGLFSRSPTGDRQGSRRASRRLAPARYVASPGFSDCGHCSNTPSPLPGGQSNAQPMLYGGVEALPRLVEISASVQQPVDLAAVLVHFSS